ncbi:phosphatase PAP2 family protein [Nocardioides immobilis]|uniref:Phosphatase PAP2 family protein n=1 Tax=Nocardioides immobilis TaxID=2049295 RepID=A0A417XVD5_9ACTN|nr:phosphatase PAP2 family protein [Nocardioides immobilis]RHW24137.1 phosphatase PAP2 family protein [Nocardioides immobilis]
MGGRSHQFDGLRWGAGFTTGAVTVAIANAIAIALGFVAKALQDPVDEPVFGRVDEAGNTQWTDVLETLTQMGNVAQTQYLGAALAVGLAIWFALQGWRWWMPLFLFPVAWWIARLCQLTIAAIVDRDRDVVSLIGTQIGAFPSGGCARIMIISGAAVVLASYYAGLSRRTTRWLYVIPLLLGLAEGYFRTRLNQHWFTDVVGGILYGGLMLAALVRTLRAFDPAPATVGLARPSSRSSSPQADVLGANP